MIKDNLASELEQLGINADNVSLLTLVPLVYVAWADGKMERIEADRILAYAKQHFALTDDARDTLQNWLSERPSDEYFARGMRDLYRLAQAPDQPQVNLDDLPSLLAHCEAVARASAKALGSPEPWSVSVNEERALQNVAQMLRVDTGRSWSQLLRDIDDTGVPAETSNRVSAPPAQVPPNAHGPEGEERDRRPLRSFRTEARHADDSQPEPKGGVV